MLRNLRLIQKGVLNNGLLIPHFVARNERPSEENGRYPGMVKAVACYVPYILFVQILFHPVT